MNLPTISLEKILELTMISKIKKCVALTAAFVMCSVMLLSAATLCDEEATQTTKNVYKFLCDRKDASSNRVLEGQHLGSIQTINDGTFEIEPFNKGGKYPALVGARYDWLDESVKPAVYKLDLHYGTEMNKRLTDVWNTQHSIIHITTCPPNPWNPNKGRESGDNYNGNIHELLLKSPPSPKKDFFWKSMETNAILLKQLADKDIPVLLRPLPEYNTKKYYTYNQSSDDFKQLWRDCYDFYVHKKHLHNLIFCWEAWMLNRNGTLADIVPWYPGDEYVDVVGAAVYWLIDKDDNYFEGNKLVLHGNDKVVYDSLINLCARGNKPFGATQYAINYGIKRIKNHPPVESDNAKTINFINNSPLLTFVYYWGGNMALNTTTHWDRLVNDINVCTHDELPDWSDSSASSVIRREPTLPAKKEAM
jgi:hypothetical protein